MKTHIVILILVCIGLSLQGFKTKSNKRTFYRFKDIHQVLNYMARVFHAHGYTDFAKDIQENVQIVESSSGSALTFNNQVIQICTKKFESQYNDIIYVLIHELTHVYLRSSVHDSLFHKQNKVFLNMMVNAGVYNPTDSTNKICEESYTSIL